MCRIRNFILVCVVLLPLHSDAFAQRNKERQTFYSLISRALEHPDDDKLMSAIADAIVEIQRKKFEALRPKLEEQLNTTIAEIERTADLSDSSRKKLSIAAKGAILRLQSIRSESFTKEVTQELAQSKDDENNRQFLNFALITFRNLENEDIYDLAGQLEDLELWKKAVRKVASSSDFQQNATERRVRFMNAMDDLAIMQIDKQVHLSPNQIAPLDRKLKEIRESSNLISFFSRNRSRDGIIGSQYWGNTIPLSPSVVLTQLTEIQINKIIHQGRLLHLSFNGHFEDNTVYSRPLQPRHLKLDRDALFVPGIYRPSQAVQIQTPELDEKDFTVGIRVKPRFDANARNRRRCNILTADRSNRWFGLHVDQSTLVLTANNQRFSQKINGVKLKDNEWVDIVCSVDLNANRIRVWVNNELVDTVRLPKDFEFNVNGKAWLFTNLSNGQVLHGHVDELLILGHAITKNEFSQLANFSVFGKPDPDHDFTSHLGEERIDRWLQATVEFTVASLDLRLFFTAKQRELVEKDIHRICEQTPRLFAHGNLPDLVEIASRLSLPKGTLDARQSDQLEKLNTTVEK